MLVGILLGQAVEIGRQYGQHALFDVRDGETFAVSWDTPEERSLRLCSRSETQARAGRVNL